MAAYTDWAVGNKVSADNLNSRLVEMEEGINSITSDSSTWDDTPEVNAGTVTADLISGEVYWVIFEGRISSDVANDVAGIRIREDTGVSGTQLNFGTVPMPSTSGNGFSFRLRARYTAVSTASKTFSVTGQRTAGTGVAHRVRASASAPAYLTIERVLN